MTKIGGDPTHPSGNPLSLIKLAPVQKEGDNTRRRGGETEREEGAGGLLYKKLPSSLRWSSLVTCGHVWAVEMAEMG